MESHADDDGVEDRLQGQVGGNDAQWCVAGRLYDLEAHLFFQRFTALAKAAAKGSHGVRNWIARSVIGRCLLAVGGPVMGTQLMRKRTRNIVIKKDFHDRNPSLMREAMVNDCLYLLRVEIINVGYLIGGKARLIVVQDEVSLHTGVLENRHPAQFALYLLNLLAA
jgi:hypothetical protein